MITLNTELNSKSKQSYILCGMVGVVCELQRVQCGGESGTNVTHDQSLKALHVDWCECYWAVVLTLQTSSALV